jgi:hypothetical protein
MERNTTQTHARPGKVNTLPPKGTIKYGVDVEGMTTYVLPTDLVLVPNAAIKPLGKRNRGTVGEGTLYDSTHTNVYTSLQAITDERASPAKVNYKSSNIISQSKRLTLLYTNNA